MSNTRTSANIPSQLTWELLAFLENARASAEAVGRALELADQAGREDIAEALKAWQQASLEPVSRLREVMEKGRAGEDKRRDKVEEASVESFPSSDPPSYY